MTETERKGQGPDRNAQSWTTNDVTSVDERCIDEMKTKMSESSFERDF